MKASVSAIVLLIALFSAAGSAGEKGSSGSQGILASPEKAFLDVNNISTVLWNNGFADIDTSGLKGGCIFPKGSKKVIMYQSGLLWGTRVSGDIHIGGSTYWTGLQPGKILAPSVAEDPALPKNRIYRVRPDYKTADLSSESVNEGRSPEQIKAQYELDWNQWPASDGAPFQDINNNGVYDPSVDIPGVEGADQSIWFVCNDLDSSRTKDFYGTPPIGIEMQVAAWAFAQPSPMDNLFFKSYTMINKSTVTFDSMYVAPWLDPDIGFSIDDYAGCDTLLSLGYAYNSTPVDSLYKPLPPPAAGVCLLQGPVVPSPGNTAASRGRKVSDAKNLPMTAFYWFGRGGPDHADPTHGGGSTIGLTNAERWYNIFRGLVGVSGDPYLDPITNKPTTFMVSGDPVKKTGYLDGILLSAGDRRMVMPSGPFSMAPGDTQEVVVAEIAAGAFSPVTYLDAVDLLKYYAEIVRTQRLVGVPDLPVPTVFELAQNYPNPFNPTTTIRYFLPGMSRVSLKIYNILGQEVRTLVDESQMAGEKTSLWNGTNNAGHAVASGVYFYRLSVQGTGGGDHSVTQVRKMILMR